MFNGETHLEKLPLGTRIKIHSNGPFICYGRVRDKRTHIYGPGNVTERICKFRSQHSHIEISAMDDVMYTLDIVTPEETKEVISKESMTLTVDEVGESTEEKFRRIVHQELSKTAVDQERESFEESDDFDVDDDDDLIERSGYEVHDMQPMHEFSRQGSRERDDDVLPEERTDSDKSITEDKSSEPPAGEE